MQPPCMPPCWAELTPGSPSRATAPSTTENQIFLMMHLFFGPRTATAAARLIAIEKRNGNDRVAWGAVTGPHNIRARPLARPGVTAQR